jgi:hypothetical protein
MIDARSPHFSRSLAEAAAWCALQSLGLNDADLPAMRQRRALSERATQLWKEACTLSQQASNLKIADTVQYQEAMALLKRVRDSYGPLEHQLRSTSLKPTFALDEFRSEVPWAEAVARVVAKRGELVGPDSADKYSVEVEQGRLLLYNPTENLADSAAQFSSNGFFDADNVPPWDIWVSFSDWTLVSWVPPTLIEAVQMGIDANPENCIRWAN